jgi:hypothetical protein
VTDRNWLAVGLATGPADRVEAEDAVRTAYRLAGRPGPDRIEWQGSPRAGALAAARLTAGADGGEAGRSVRADVRTRPWANARAVLAARLGGAGWAEHWTATGARTWQLLVDRLITPVRTRLDAELADDETGRARMALLDAVHGQHDAAWLPAFDGVPELDGLARVARAAGWWWPYERVAVLTERPVVLERDNLGRLHHGDGPALSYPDGWGMHAWRGMPIPPEVAARLPALTAQEIRAESNAEMRRVMVEYFGYERYLRETGATEVHSDEFGTLWRAEVPGDEPLVMVQVLNSTPEPDGTRRTYFLRVPPNIATAREAVAWTFGLIPEEYAPQLQT